MSEPYTRLGFLNKQEFYLAAWSEAEGRLDKSLQESSMTVKEALGCALDWLQYQAPTLDVKDPSDHRPTVQAWCDFLAHQGCLKGDVVVQFARSIPSREEQKIRTGSVGASPWNRLSALIQKIYDKKKALTAAGLDKKKAVVVEGPVTKGKKKKRKHLKEAKQTEQEVPVAFHKSHSIKSVVRLPPPTFASPLDHMKIMADSLDKDMSTSPDPDLQTTTGQDIFSVDKEMADSSAPDMQPTTGQDLFFIDKEGASKASCTAMESETKIRLPASGYDTPEPDCRCQHCGLQGHLSTECKGSSSQELDWKPPKTYSCTICGRTGDHFYAFCPANQVSQSMNQQKNQRYKDDEMVFKHGGFADDLSRDSSSEGRKPNQNRQKLTRTQFEPASSGGPQKTGSNTIPLGTPKLRNLETFGAMDFEQPVASMSWSQKEQKRHRSPELLSSRKTRKTDDIPLSPIREREHTVSKKRRLPDHGRLSPYSLEIPNAKRGRGARKDTSDGFEKMSISENTKDTTPMQGNSNDAHVPFVIEEFLNSIVADAKARGPELSRYGQNGYFGGQATGQRALSVCTTEATDGLLLELERGLCPDTMTRDSPVSEEDSRAAQVADADSAFSRLVLQDIQLYKTEKPLRRNPPYHQFVLQLFQNREHPYVAVVKRKTAIQMWEQDEPGEANAVWDAKEGASMTLYEEL